MIIDKSWRTGLGIAFYDRDSEINELIRSISYGKGTTLILGPRNVGKSELVRYVTAKYLPSDVSIVVIDFRKLVAGEVLGSITFRVEDAVKDAVTALASIAGAPGIADLVLRFVRELARLARDATSRYVILVLDEFHFISDSVHHALSVLESLAKMATFYREFERLKLVVSDSEGLFTHHKALRRLLGYSVITMYVEPLPYGVMRELYREYVGKHGTPLPFEVVFKLIGGCPGYLAEIDAYVKQYGVDKGLDLWINTCLSNLNASLASAGMSLGLKGEEVIKHAYNLVSGFKGEEFLSSPETLELAGILAEGNIVYVKHGREVKSQLPIYRLALEVALKTGTTDILTRVKEELLNELRIRE